MFYSKVLHRTFNTVLPTVGYEQNVIQRWFLCTCTVSWFSQEVYSMQHMDNVTENNAVDSPSEVELVLLLEYVALCHSMLIHVFLHKWGLLSHQISSHFLNKISGAVHPFYNVKLFVTILVMWEYKSIAVVLYRMRMKPIWIVSVSFCHLTLFYHVLFHPWCINSEIPSTDKEWFLSKMF
jgi:hypothetical protein